MSTIDRAAMRQWKPWLQALDPWRVMRPEELDELYAERPETPVQRIIEDLIMAEHPQAIKVLFCGARGSGKSTELTRVGAALSQDFAVVQVDVNEALKEGQGTLAVLAMLGVACVRAVQVWQKPDGDLQVSPDGAVTNPASRLSEALALFGVASEVLAGWVMAAGPVLTLFGVEGAEAAAQAGTAVLATSKASQQSATAFQNLSDIGKSKLQKPVHPDSEQNAKALVSALTEILEQLREASGRQPLLLVDGLDQLATVDEVRAALADAHLLQQLDVPILFTGPIQIRHDASFSELPGRIRPLVLHNLSVVSHDDAGDIVVGPELAVLKDAFVKRRTRFKLPDDLIPAPLVEQMARISSGIVRDFFTLLHEAGREAMRNGQVRISQSHVDAAVRQRRHFLQLSLNDRKLDILARVLEGEKMTGGEEGEELLFTNIIACYKNNDLWFRPHEALVDYVGRHLSSIREDRREPQELTESGGPNTQ